MEATGIYFEGLAFYLNKKKGIIVSVVNPSIISSYGKSQLSRIKTDQSDAQLLARYCERERPTAWKPPSKEVRELLKMVRQCEHLKQCKQKEVVRLQPADKIVKTSVKASVRFFSNQVILMQKKIKAHIEKHTDLNEGYRLLKEIPGIGDNTAQWLLAILENGERFEKAKQAACFVGLTPRHWESGSSVKGKTPISKVGPSDARKNLYMPALAVCYGRYPKLQTFVNRLEANGKSKKEIIVAMMRKLVTIAQAVLKTRVPYKEALQAG